MGTFVGTPLYVAPEMLEFSQAGRFSDLWALGCILYEMIEGRSPFVDEASSKVFSNIMERNLKFPNSFDS
jgi:serine/threonine protein kinase